MDAQQEKRHVAGVAFLAIMMVACAWLIPTSNGLAASAADSFSVKVAVTDSVQTQIGQIPTSSISDSGHTQVVANFVTREASKLPARGFISNEISSFGAIAESTLAAGLGADPTGQNGATPGDGIITGSEPADEIVVTVSSL